MQLALLKACASQGYLYWEWQWQRTKANKLSKIEQGHTSAGKKSAIKMFAPSISKLEEERWREEVKEEFQVPENNGTQENEESSWIQKKREDV